MDLVELEQRARELMERSAYDYYAGGADDELTLADNVAAWGRLRLRPHVLRDVSAVSTATTVLGREVAMPVLVAPAAAHRLAHDEGEVATARAAAEVGTVLTLSTVSTVSMEDVAAAVPGAPRWFQLYIQTDRGVTAELVTRAAAAGYEALVVTVDLPYPGRRLRDLRNNFTLPHHLMAANLGARPDETDEGSGFLRFIGGAFDASLTMADLAWLQGLSDLPLVVKGVLRGDDARDCMAEGAAAIVVSNHGGRQLDSAIATADALAEVVAAVGDDVEVYVDGGVRRGTDVVKALALGARATMVGRPVLWGLAVGGAKGAHAVLEDLRAELALALALCGCPNVEAVTRDLLATA